MPLEQSVSLHRNCTKSHIDLLRCRSRRAGTPPARAPLPPRAQQQEQESAAAVVPKVGWLWDRKAADTRQRLKEQNHRPKKSLGQNFMLDDGVLRGIVSAAGVQAGDLVLEVGPGTGNLTRHLLAAGALVTAVEKDEGLAAQLEAEFAGVPQLRLVCGDILRQDMSLLLEGMQQHAQQLQQHGQQQQQGPDEGQQQQQLEQLEQLEQQQQLEQQAVPTAAAEGTGSQQQQHQQQQQAADQQQQAAGAGHSAPPSPPPAQAPVPVKVVANLPYYITKDCLNLMLPLAPRLSHLYFMLQDEVGVRLTQPEPGAADWRAMNLITQYYSTPKYLFQIDRRKYLPAPKVHGAMVAFHLLPPGQRLAVPCEADFLKLVKKAFSQRRKVVRNALRPLYQPADVAAALQAAGLSVDARAQDLTLLQFADLAWQLQTAAAAQGQQQADAAETQE